MIEGPRTTRRPAAQGGRSLAGGSGPAPTLLRLLERLTDRKRRVLVPGHTGGLDALAWAGAGHEVVCADSSPHLLRVCAERGRTVGMRIRVLQMDPSEPLRELDGEFDVVWERSCFCALEPDRRERYVAGMARLLKPAGVLYGLFRAETDVTEACVRSYFQRDFEVVRIEEDGSEGSGILVMLRRRDWRPGPWRR